MGIYTLLKSSITALLLLSQNAQAETFCEIWNADINDNLLVLTGNTTSQKATKLKTVITNLCKSKKEDDIMVAILVGALADKKTLLNSWGAHADYYELAGIPYP